MAKRATPLEVLTIPEPCPVPWDEMAGDGERRFCDRCEAVVHDLEALGPRAANELLATEAGELCVRARRTRRWHRPSPASRRAALQALAAVVLVATVGCATGRAGGSESSRRSQLKRAIREAPRGALTPEQAWSILRDAGWTDEEIQAEALAHRARSSEPGFTPPREGSVEAKLQVLLTYVGRELERVKQMHIDHDAVFEQGFLVGRRG